MSSGDVKHGYRRCGSADAPPPAADSARAAAVLTARSHMATVIDWRVWPAAARALAWSGLSARAAWPPPNAPLLVPRFANAPASELSNRSADVGSSASVTPITE